MSLNFHLLPIPYNISWLFWLNMGFSVLSTALYITGNLLEWFTISECDISGNLLL